MAYFNKPVVSAGNYQTEISQIGKIGQDENGNTILTLVEKSQYGYSVAFKFGRDKISHYINFPFFKVSTEDNINNYLAINKFKVNGVIQANPTNETQAGKSYTDQYVTWMTDLLEVYVPNVEGKTKRETARNLVYDFMRKAKVCNMAFEVTPFYNYYGHYEENVWITATENSEPTNSLSKKGNTVFYGKINDNNVYLTVVNLSGIDYYFYETDRSTLFDLEHDEEVNAQLEWASNAYTVWMGNLLELCFNYVIENNKGQKGNIYRTWVESTKGTSKGNWYLTPVTSLKSLIKTLSSIKVNNEYVTVTPENQNDYPEFKSYYYGTGRGDIYSSRLQFCFKAEPFDNNVEGNDLTVTYRSKYNPKFYMDKPEVIIEDESYDESLQEESISSEMPF